LLWKLDFTTEGPILKFNSTVFPSAAGVENYLPFAALVLPEAVRTIMGKIADQPDMLDDENDSLHPWGEWLDSFGIERPDRFDDDEKAEWCDRIIDVFCNRHSFATRLGSDLTARSMPND